jgi:hypothetical protein
MPAQAPAAHGATSRKFDLISRGLQIAGYVFEVTQKRASSTKL